MANSTPAITNTKLLDLVRTYWAWRRLWIATTFAFGSFALLYVLVLKTDQWTASQGIIVRDEANGAVMRLGRFQSQTEMKAAQETILEMARNSQVLREALLELGPPQTVFDFGAADQNWPSQREIADLADESIGVRAPKGAEFGTTEVIYLDIKQSSRERAVKLNQSVCKALDNRLRQVRMARAEGVINELVRASNMATEELRRATEQLQVIEREAGADLADLRGLTESNGNASSSRVLLDNVKTELRQIENQHVQLMTDLSMLRDTQTDPERLLSAPASILNAHPGLRKLREGLADAQLATSQLRGRFTSSHPLLYVATTSETEIKHQLQAELSVALATAQKDVENSQGRIEVLKGQQRQLEERLERLARIRADHANLNQEVRSRNTILQEVERQLADARAARDAASSTSLLTRIDEPVLGERPVGPGRTTILAGMTLAGLFMGLGIVFLLTPLDGQSSGEERWNERLGRRLSDRFPWLADQSAASAPRRRRNDVDRRSASAAPPNATRPGYFTRRQSDRIEPVAPSNSNAANPNSANPNVANRKEDSTQLQGVSENSLHVNYLAANSSANASVVGAREVELAPELNAMASRMSPSELASLPPQALRSTWPAALNAAPAESEPRDGANKAEPNKAEPNKAEPVVDVSARLESPAIAAAPATKPRLVDVPSASTNSTPAPQPASMFAQTQPTAVNSVVAKPAAMNQAAMNQAAMNQAAVNSITAPSVQGAFNASAATASVTTPPVTNAPVAAATAANSQAATTQAATTQAPTIPRAARNMFRPNQAADIAASQAGLGRPSQAPMKPTPMKPAPVKPASFTPTPLNPAPNAPMPLIPGASAFESPVEGGLAGIGMPTQRLPDSFAKP